MASIVPRLGGWLIVPVSLLVAVGATAPDLRLVEAVRARDVATARALLREGVDVNAPQGDGATALHWAAHWNDVELSGELIRAGARVNAANVFGVVPLKLACLNGSAAMVDVLLNADADPQIRPETGETPLMTAALTGNLHVVIALLTRGADVNATEPSGQTALMWSLVEGHLDVARALIDRGANVTAASKSGFTPLLFAARHNRIEAAKLLLEKGAHVEETAADGSSALLVATVRGHADFAKFLLERGANPNADKAGYTALHWAVHTMETELTGPFGIVAESGEWSALDGLPGDVRNDLLQALLEHGANPNARLGKEPPFWGHKAGMRMGLSLTGGTPYVLAAKAGDVESMRVLLAAGADPKLATYDDTTALMGASGYGRIIGMSNVTESRGLAAAKLALEMGNDVNGANKFGETALHGAAYEGWDSVVQFLVDQGAAVNVRSKTGETPLDIAEGKVYHSGGYQPHPTTAALIRKLSAQARF